MIILAWLLYLMFICAVLCTLILMRRFRHRLQRRVMAVRALRYRMRKTVGSKIEEDIAAKLPWSWRIKDLEAVSLWKMVWSRKQLNPENFYKSTNFLKSSGQKAERKQMYLLMAYIGGEWGMVGIEAHEEHAVEFISFIDNMFGEGTAFVCKLPDKSNHHNTDEIQKHVDLAAFLAKLDNNEVDLDAELSKLTKEQDGK